MGLDLSTLLKEFAAQVSVSGNTTSEDSYLLGGFPSSPPKGGQISFEDYLRLRSDHKVFSALRSRVAASLNRPCVVTPGGAAPADLEAKEFVKSQLLGSGELNQSGTLDRFAGAFLSNAILLGVGVCEIIWERKDSRIILKDARNRNPKNFVFVRPRKGLDPERANHLGYELRLKDRAHPDGIPLPDKKFFCLSFGSGYSNPYGVGLGAVLWWLVRLKRDALKFWLIYADKFGSPAVVGKIDSPEEFSEKELRDLESRLLAFAGAMRQGSYGVLPGGTDISLLESSWSGKIAFEEIVSYFDQAIVESILGNFQLEAGQGLSGAPAKNDEAVRLEIARLDADLLHERLNRTLVQWMVKLNFPSATPPQIWRDFREKESKEEKLNQDLALKQIGYSLRPEAVESRYGDLYQEDRNPASAGFHEDTPPLTYSEIANLAGGSTVGRSFADRLFRN